MSCCMIDFSKIKVRPYPTRSDLLNPYIFGGVRAVINVSEKEDKEICDFYQERGIDYHHYPLKENVNDMGWDNIIAAVKILINNLKEGIPTVVHCIGGNNRSRVVVECVYYVIWGKHLADEYKGYSNHLIYNVSMGFLPLDLNEVESQLKRLY